MAIDIRANVSCTLGTVISGNFADDYLQNSGIIKTRGEVVLAGTLTPKVGTLVSFTYTKNDETYNLPRVLRVLSSFADPFRRTTTVQLGCKLTYLENRKPAVEKPNSKDENNVPCYVYEKATLPISASYVFSRCLGALGLSSDPIPLTNRFSVEEFDLTPGYIQVMSDLLQSEGYVGYLDSTETLRIRSLTAGTGSGPVIKPEDIAELGPIGSGDLPGESVLVRWSNLRLLPPEDLDSDELLRRNWEMEEVFGPPTEVTVSYTNDEGVLVQDLDLFYPYTFSASRYDQWERKIESISLTLTSSAEVNNRWASDKFKFGHLWNVPTARLVREVFEYELGSFPRNNVNFLQLQQIGGSVSGVKAQLAAAGQAQVEPANECKNEPPEGYDVVKSQTTYSYFSELELAGSLNIDTYIILGPLGDEVGILGFDTVAGEYESIVVVEYETDQAAGVTKTVTKRSISKSQTVTGQQDLAKQAQDIDPTDLTNDVNALLFNARKLVYIGAEVRSTTQREYGLQKRPTSAERNNTANSKPQISESVSDFTWVVGSTTSTSVTEFTLPYAPDDIISWSEAGGYSSTPSDAKQKALRYGRVQNALLLGNRNGVSLQLAPEKLPKRPFDLLYVEAGGITGAYRVNGSSWAFDANGIVASTDALLWGAVSAASGTDLASSWVPLAPGTTSLPLPYTPSSGSTDSETGVSYSAVITPSVVLPPYVESVTLEGATRSTAQVVEYPYVLNRGVVTQEISTRTSAVLSQVQGTVVVLEIKTGLGDVVRLDPGGGGGGGLTETKTISIGLEPVVVRYEAPLVVFGHTAATSTGGQYITLARIYQNSVQNVTGNLSSQPPSRIVDVSISPDASRLAYFVRNEPWFGWYTNEDYALTNEGANSDQPSSFGQSAFSPRGEHLFVEDQYDSPYYSLFRTTGAGFSRINNALDVLPTGRIKGFGYSADGRYFAAAYLDQLRVYEVRGDNYVSVASATMPASTSTSYGGLSWTPDNSRIAVGLASSPFVCVHSFTGSSLSLETTAISLTAAVIDLAFAPNGRYLAIAFATSPWIVVYTYSAGVFTQVTANAPTVAGTIRALAWTGYSDYLVIQRAFVARIYKVDHATNAFTEATGSPFSLPNDVFAVGSLSVYPTPPVVLTPATGGTETITTSLIVTAVAFDPSSPQAFQAVNAAPRLGANPATSSSGWTLIQDANADDSFSSAVSLPFNVTIDGASFNTVFVESNSYLSFGTGSGDIPFDASFPEVYKLLVVTGDYSYQRAYIKVGPNYAILRYEGFNNYNGTTPGNSDIIWEVALTEPDSGTGGQVIEVRMGINNPLDTFNYALDTINVCNATASLASTTASKNTSYIIEGNATGTSWTFTSGASLTAI